AVTAVDGVSDFEVNLETKVVSITFDDQKVNPEQLKDAIVAVKHTAEDYDANDVIERTVSFKAEQIHCGGCVSKVQKNLSAESGIISVEADAATKQVKVQYDANKVSSSEFKNYFKKFDYTVTRYWESEKVKYARFTGEQIGDKLAELEKSLKDLKGVLDFTINEKTNTVAVAYNQTVLAEDVLAENIKKNDLNLVASK
ncbi:MAG: cation transporter, partial [Candidatus Symbiothrix sp.]|nr:cation transporter [Candidatus Symbiothrix sp.]